jgi:hypothetical protein
MRAKGSTFATLNGCNMGDGYLSHDGLDHLQQNVLQTA